MRELVGRLAELDPDAGAAVKVIAYFDRLVEGGAGPEPIVRGAAVLTGVTARLVDDERRVRVRVDPQGHVHGEIGPPDPDWLSAPLLPGGPPALWLERPGPAGPVEAMVLERAVAAARTALGRMRRPAVATLLDDSVPAPARLRAGRQLGIGETTPVRAVALPGGQARIERPSGDHWPPGQAESPRAGIGPTVELLELPASWTAARTALRFTAEGTDQDPGPSVVYADQLGGLAVLASAIGPETEPIADVRAVERARVDAPWALPTLVAVAGSPSLRTAATALLVHHSTLQERLGHVEHVLGWPIRDPRGRLRLQLALALWRLHRHP